MTDLASLGIQVDSTQTTGAAAALDRLTASGATAEQRIASLKSTNDGYQSSLEQVAAMIDAQNNSLKLTSSELETYRTRIQAQVSAMQGATQAANQYSNAVNLLAMQVGNYQKMVAAGVGVNDKTIGYFGGADQVAKVQAVIAAQQALGVSTKEAAAQVIGGYVAEGAAAEEGAVKVIAANDAIILSSLQTREIISATRFALEGNFTRAAGSLSVLANSTGLLTALFSPLGLAVVAVVGTFVAATVATIQYEAAQRELMATTLGLGAASQLSAGQIASAGQQIAQTTQQSTASATKSAESFADAGVKTQNTIVVLSDTVSTYAALTGQKAAQAQKDLASAMADPAKGAIDLNDKLNILSDAQMRQIETLAAAGDKEAAVTLLTKALTDRTSEAQKAGVGLAGQWDVLIGKAGDLWSMLGKVNLQLQLFSAYGFASGAVQQQAEGQASAAAAAAQRQAAYNKASSAAGDVANSTPEGQAATTLQQLQASAAKLKAGVAAESGPDGNAASLARDQQALEDYTRAIQTFIPAAEKQHDIAVQQELLAKARQSHSKADVDAITQRIALLKIAGEVISPQDAAQQAADAGNVASAKTRIPKPKVTSAERFDTGTDKVEKDAEGTLKLGAAYLISDAAALKAEASAKAHTDAIGKDASAVDIAARATADFNLEIAKAIETADKHTAQMRDQLTIETAANDNQAAGNINAAAANQLVAKQTQLLPLATALAAAQGTTQAEAAKKAYDAQALVIDQQYQEKLRTGLLASNEAMRDQSVLLEVEISNINMENRARVVQIAQLQEIQKLTAQGVNLNSPAAKAAVAGAGQNAQLNDKLNSAQALSYQKQAAQIAQSVASDIKFNSDRVARYRSAEDQIDQMVRDGTLTFQQGEHAKTTIQITQQQERIQYLDQALTDIATLSQSSNKTIAGIGKAAAVIQATIDGVLAIQKTLASTPYPWNIPLAAAEGVMTAANIAKIEGMAEGGIIGGSGGPKADDKLIRVSSGEAVVNAEGVANNRAVIEAINRGAIIPRFASGGLVASNAGQPANSNTASGLYFDMRGANFGGADADQIEARFRKIMVNEYGPQIVATAVKSSLVSSTKLGNRQQMNPNAATRHG